MTAAREIYFRVDDSWAGLAENFETVDVCAEAEGLRFIASRAKIERFAGRYGDRFRPFTLTGSGDFHHLSAVWIRQFREPCWLLSFDNHPDWDIRPPFWACGAWINRALELPSVRGASVWGCGNFECEFPGRLLGNRRAARRGKLEVHPWRRATNYPSWLWPMDPATWRADFACWTEKHAGERLYVTIDIDCLRANAAVTNWENGRFTVADLVWALGLLREKATLIGGDLCGAYSQPRYATRFQRLAARFDHPAERADLVANRRVNTETGRRLWAALTGKHGD